MDFNVTAIGGRVAATPELREFESGAEQVRLLVTVRTTTPRRRVDVLPVTFWKDGDTDEWQTLLGLDVGQAVWVTAQVQRRFWADPFGRRSQLDLVGMNIITHREDEDDA